MSAFVACVAEENSSGALPDCFVAHGAHVSRRRGEGFDTVWKQDLGASVTAMAVSHDVLVISDDNKNLHMWNPVSGEKLSSLVVKKRVVVLHIATVGERRVIIFGDRFGDVRAVRTDLFQAEHTKFLLQHTTSNIACMCMVPGLDHIITGDTDEKIRVSYFPATHGIRAYCHGHTAAVTSLCVPTSEPQILLSTSADGTLRIWEWGSGTQLQVVDVGCLVGEAKSAEPVNPAGGAAATAAARAGAREGGSAPTVPTPHADTTMVFDAACDRGAIAVAGVSKLQTFTLEQRIVRVGQSYELPSSALSCCLRGSGNVVVLCGDPQNLAAEGAVTLHTLRI